MQNEIIKLDVAETRPVYIGESTEAEKKHQAIWNLDKKALAAIVSKDYKLIQHGEVAREFLKAINGLGIKHTTKIANHGNRFFMDVLFTDAKEKIHLKEGEDFAVGFRLINSYDKTTGIIVLPRLMRLVCENGMVMKSPTFVETFHYRHNQKMAENFAEYLEKAIHETVNNNDKFKAVVNDCIGDSIEWSIAKKLMKGFLARKKHFEEVMKLLKQDVKNKKVTRWDIYNSLTNYATHGKQLKHSAEMWLYNKSEQVMNTPIKQLIEVTHK